MRALLGMLLFSIVGCDSLWSSYIGMGDFGRDGGTTCAVAGSCDMAVADFAINPNADLLFTNCSSNTDCGPAASMCDQNTGMCVVSLPTPAEAFPLAFETSKTLNRPYMIMATGDYDGDGILDVAVSGVLTPPGTAPSSNNATGAMAANVDFYRGDGVGGLMPDSTCTIPTDSPVALLTVPGTGAQSDLLVATFGATVYRCIRNAGTWGQTTVQITAPMPNGLKQIALASLEGQTYPDLLVRTSNTLFIDSANTGSLDIKRSAGNVAKFAGASLPISTSDVTWVLPFRFGGGNGDTIATTWDGIALHPGVEFHYVPSAGMETKSSGLTAGANTGTAGFSELNGTPFAAATLFHVANQAAISLLYTYSLKPTSVSVLTGISSTLFAVVSQKNLTTGPLSNITLPYAGDANGDGQDEIGLYSIGANNATSPLRHLQLLSYSGSTINITSPIVDITSLTDNYRGMALANLAKPGDRRRDRNRKDLIMLVETPGSNSKLIVRRANLNVAIP